MTPRSWIRQLFARTPRRAPHGPRQPPPRFRPGLDVLEDRLTPSRLGTTALLEGPAAGSASDVVSTRGPWSASSNALWLHSSAAGTDNGLATFTFDANPGATRSGTLTIAGQTLTVTQAGSSYVPANSFTTLVSGLSLPNGVAVDAAGDVFIADTDNNAVKEWHAATGTVSTLVSSGLNHPQGVAVDGAGDVFIADTNNGAVKEWHAVIGTVSTLVSGPMSPTGVAVDAAGNVFIIDMATNALLEWHVTTGDLSRLVSSGLDGPTGVAVDGAGDVFFADFYGIGEWNAATGTVSTLVPPGPVAPYGVAVDGAGDVFIADNFHDAIQELPRAFVPGGALTEGPAAGTDALPPVLPATQSLSGPFAPSSDQDWLTIDGVANGVVHFAFTPNTGPSRTAHLSVLGQQVTVTQAGAGLTQPQPAPVTPAAAFVQALYRNLLGRDADAQGLANWTASLEAEGTRLQVVQGVWASPEHRGRQVDQFYTTYLHRGADPAGRTFWTNALQGGLSETAVANAFLTSDEYLQGHRDPTAYLTGLYADVLGRSADAAGLAFWQQTAQGGMSGAALAEAFLDSREANQRLVDRSYAEDLGRPADPAGAAAWVEALASHRLTPARVEQMILASEEFFAHAHRTA
jgi:streptogramin lyase